MGAILNNITNKKHKSAKQKSGTNRPRKGHLFTGEELKQEGKASPGSTSAGNTPVGQLRLLPLCACPQITTKAPHLSILVLQINCRGLPWWRSGWESACQCRGHGFEAWSGKIPHAAEQLGPWATITEPARLEPVLRNKRGHDSERPAHHDEEWSLLATTRESPRTETKTQHSHK